MDSFDFDMPGEESELQQASSIESQPPLASMTSSSMQAHVPSPIVEEEPEVVDEGTRVYVRLFPIRIISDVVAVIVVVVVVVLLFVVQCSACFHSFSLWVRDIY
jgi:hypothetical protein